MRRIHRTDIGTRRVDLGEGDWVEIRTRQLSGDRQHIAKAAVHFKADGDEKPTFEFDTSAGNYAALERMVIGWGGPGFCEHDHDADGTVHMDGTNGCAPIPMSREAFEVMDPDDFQRLVDEINGLPTQAAAKS